MKRGLFDYTEHIERLKGMLSQGKNLLRVGLRARLLFYLLLSLIEAFKNTAAWLPVNACCFAKV